MRLQNLHLLNFKNYEEANLEFPARINVLVGKNGSGKTNLLDAIYYLSCTKSAFATSDQSLVRHDQSSFMAKGDFAIDAKAHTIASSVQTGSKKIFRLDTADYQKLSEHIGKFPVIFMAPDDVDLIREGGELRRKFFDGIISQLDYQYLQELMRYNHFLKQRNSLLRMASERGSIDWVAIEAYDNALTAAGNYILRERRAFISVFLTSFQDYYGFIVGGQESTDLRYVTELDEQDFPQGLFATRQKDLALQRTTFGIHRDDFVFTIGGRDIKKLGSQGQQKSFVIAMKLAQYEILKKRKSFRPVLLLDDIFDKLDDSRIQRLLDLMKGDLGQLFITDARPDRTSTLLHDVNVESDIFKIENGRITS